MLPTPAPAPLISKSPVLLRITESVPSWNSLKSFEAPIVIELSLSAPSGIWIPVLTFKNPDTTAPPAVVSNLLTLLWYKTTAPFSINFAIVSVSPAFFTLNSVALIWTLSSLSIWRIPVVLLINEFVALWKICKSLPVPSLNLPLSSKSMLRVPASKLPPNWGEVSSTTSTFASFVLAIAAEAFTLALVIAPSAISALAIVPLAAAVTLPWASTVMSAVV